MAKIIDVTDVAEELLKTWAAWYNEPQMPQAFNICDDRVVEMARKLAEDDWRRMVVNADCSITVHNRPMW